MQSKLIKESWLFLCRFHSPAIWIFVSFPAKMVEQMLCAYATYMIQGLVASISIAIYICIASQPGGNLSAELAHAYKLVMGFYCQHETCWGEQKSIVRPVKDVQPWRIRTEGVILSWMLKYPS